MPRQPLNILYLHCHDAGRYLSPYGYAVPTPNLKTLAARSTLYRNMHTVSPTCSPSRCAMLTGRPPRENGMIGLAHRGFSLKDPEQHLARVLRQYGYLTANVGIQHEMKPSSGEHFALYETVPEAEAVPATGDKGTDRLRTDPAWGRAAGDFLRQEHDRPFLLGCGLFCPHRPFPSEPRIDAKYVRAPEPFPDRDDLRQDWTGYLTAAAAMDEAVGEVLAGLREGPHADNTIVLFTTDHGPAFPQMKCNLKDFGTHVAFMLDYPGNPARGEVVDALTSHLDVLPTLRDLCGLPADPELSGSSLRPLHEGTADHLHERIFTEVNFHGGSEPMRAVRTERYKLIRRFTDEATPVPSNCDNSASKTFHLRTTGALHQERAALELYDLWLDPGEFASRADDPCYADIREELDTQLQAWMEATDDPLLHGAMPAPAGAKVNTPDAWDN